MLQSPQRVRWRPSSESPPRGLYPVSRRQGAVVSLYPGDKEQFPPYRELTRGPGF